MVPHGKAGRVSRGGQEALPGGSARCPCLRGFPEPCRVAGATAGPLGSAGRRRERPTREGHRGGGKDVLSLLSKNFVVLLFTRYGIGHLVQWWSPPVFCMVAQ